MHESDITEPELCSEKIIDTKIKPMWMVSNNKDTSESRMIQPILYKDKIIVSKSGAEFKVTVTMRELQSGKIIWENNDPMLLDFGEDAFEYHIYMDKLYYITNTNNSIPAIRVIDLNTGQIIYKELDYTIDIYTCRIGSNIYYKKNLKRLVYDSIQIWKFDMNTFTSSYVFTIEQVDGYSNNAASLSGYLLSNGDEILFYQHRMLSVNQEYRIGTRAYNLTKSKFIWSHDDLDYLRKASVSPSVYKNNKVYFKAAAMLYCYNAETGAIIWQQDVARRTNGDMLLGNMLVEEGRVIVHSNRGFVCSYDAETGVHQWTASDWADTINNLLYYNGKVYSASGADGNMHSLDIYTGRKIWNELSPNENCYPDGSFSTCYPNLDPVTGILLIEDRYFTMAVDLNK